MRVIGPFRIHLTVVRARENITFFTTNYERSGQYERANKNLTFA